MAEVDTSSYPKPGPPVSLLDQVQKYQQLESNSIGIDKQKLDLMNTQFGLMNSELSNLAATNATKEQAAQRLGLFAKTYNMPAPVVQHMMQELQQAPNVKSFAENALRRGMDVQQKINNTYGTTGEMNTGRVTQPGIVRSPLQGGGFTPSGPPIVNQLPVTTPVYSSQTGQMVPAGTQPPISHPGAVNFEGGSPSLPAARPASVATTGPTGPTRNITPGEPTFEQRYQDRGLALSPEPMFEEGKRALAQDQLIASQKATAIKPAIEALRLLPGLKTGPGTEPFNKAVAFLKNWSGEDIPKDDPTVAYQMANKLMEQYIGKQGERSDAALAAAHKAYPNISTQLNPALTKLLSDQIARDRIEIARPTAFTNKSDNNPANYGKHQATFPQSQDERAYTFDLIPKEDQEKLIQGMAARYKKNPKDKEAVRFLQSLDTARGQFE